MDDVHIYLTIRSCVSFVFFPGVLEDDLVGGFNLP